MVIRGSSSKVQFYEATISSGGSTTGEIDLQGNVLAGIAYPATMTGSNVSFKVDVDGTMTVLSKEGSDYTVPITASKVEWCDPVVFYPHSVIEIISDGTEGAERTLTLLFQGL